MTEPRDRYEEEAARRLENLRRVAAHMQSRPAPPPIPAPGARPGATSASPQRDAHAERTGSAAWQGSRPAPGSGWPHGSVTAPTAAPRKHGAGHWLRRLGPLGLILGLVLGKGKFLLAILKLAKLQTFLTMLVAVWAYAMLWGVPFAVGFVLLIFVHEMGHALVMRQQGIPAGAPVFIPFVGAVIAMKGMPRNAYVEALVGIGGPLLGTAGAAVCLLVALTTQSQFWFALASTGFLINLFNMIPISPLDGGRIAGAIARWFWAVGYVIGIAVFFVTWSPILLLILILGLFTVWGALRHPRPGYYDVPSHRRLAMGAAYFALVGVMALGMWVADAPLAGIREGRIEEQAALLGLLHLLRRDDELPLR